MKPPEPDPAPRPGGMQRLRDMAGLLPVAFGLLMLPPYIRVFDTDATVLGLPVLHVYIFGLWVAAIAASGLLAEWLTRAEQGSGPATSAPPDPDRTSEG